MTRGRGAARQDPDMGPSPWAGSLRHVDDKKKKMKKMKKKDDDGSYYITSISQLLSDSVPEIVFFGYPKSTEKWV